MPLRLGTLVTYTQPASPCEAEEVFQVCVGVVTDVAGPHSDVEPIEVIWLQRCVWHRPATPPRTAERLPVDMCWEVGQLN
jgi:hypothetical protein